MGEVLGQAEGTSERKGELRASDGAKTLWRGLELELELELEIEHWLLHGHEHGYG
jgi:hypothetical protein